jgi:hypothetical protein
MAAVATFSHDKAIASERVMLVRHVSSETSPHTAGWSKGLSKAILKICSSRASLCLYSYLHSGGHCNMRKRSQSDVSIASLDSGKL